jgi:hypothetical protein
MADVKKKALEERDMSTSLRGFRENLHPVKPNLLFL